MKGNLTDFGTATVRETRGVKQVWNKREVNIVPDARYATAVEAMAAYDAAVFVTVPIKTVNPLNLGNKAAMDWRLRKAKLERDAVLLCLFEHAHKKATLATGCVVTMTRISAGRLDPIDGLPPSLKHVRDAVAMWLLGGSIGEMDESPLIDWRYEQQSLGRGKHGVIISIRRRP